MDVAPAVAGASPPLRPVSVEEWLAIPEEQRAQLIRGAIVYDAFPGPKHGAAQGGIFAEIRPYNRRRGRGGKPGGWWLSLEVDLVVGDVGCRPDVVGWRRERCPHPPEPNEHGVVTLVPDFIGEVLSSSTARYDTGPKRDAYFKAGVSHYWLIDPVYKTLTVLEKGDRGYVIVLVAGPGETARAVPFDGVEIPVADLFLDGEEEEDAPSSP